MSTMRSISPKASLLWMLLGALLLDVTKAEFFLGDITTRAHLVAGQAYLLSDRAIEIRNFVYDGQGPNAIWWIDTEKAPTSSTGYVAADGLPSDNCHKSAANRAAIPGADGTEGPQRVELPDGMTINDFLGGSLSVWCDQFSVNFGEVVIPDVVEIPTDTVELQCFENAPPTNDGVFLSTFATLAHDLAGEVWLLSDRVLEVRNYVYDGQGPAAFFWIDTQSSPTSGGRVASDASPSGNCAMDPSDTPLPAANGITQRVELPEGTTINDFLGGSLSVWCEQFGANFGHATIPTTIEVPAVGPELECSRAAPENDPVFLGSFTSRAHLVEGDIYLVSDRVLQIRNYIYDGQGPAAFFWMDTEPLPTRNGIVVSDGYPSNGCAMSASDDPLPMADGITQYVELPPGTTIRDFAGGSLSVWCERFTANFGEVVIPSLADLPASPNSEDLLDCFDEDVMEPAPIAATPDGFNCEPLNDFFQVRWQIAGDNLNVELLGRISEDQYMGFGVSGDPQQRTWMIGADAVVVDITESGPRARDIYMDSRSQCANAIGVCPDTDGGFVNDASDVSAEEDFGLTLIRYKRPLVPTDQSAATSNGESVDKSIPTQSGIDTYIVWAIGPVSPGGFPLFHEHWPSTDVSLDFARPVVDNCPPLAFVGGTDAPTASPPPPFRRPLVGDSDGSTTFEVHIGPSGGPRGYTAITGQPSWGIAWYVNGYLIPKLTLRRGTTYTFRASGGDDPSNDAKYHPFYLTDNPEGGYRQQSPADRLAENVIAGIDIILANATGVYEYEPTLVAPICEYTTTQLSADAELSDYEDYFATLDTSCASDQSIVGQAAVLEFTPDETTPDTIYYHCVTHKDLGFEIEVQDKDAPATTLSPTAAPVEPQPLDDFTEVALQSRLVGATLNYRVNKADPAAGGVDTVTMVLEAPALAWVGLAFNNGDGLMPGSEAVIGLPDAGEVQKYNLNDRNQAAVVPMPESQQTLIDASITQTDTTTTLTFTKILVEPNEIPISIEADNTFLGAWGSSNTLGFHAQRDPFTVNLESGPLEPSPTSAPAEPSPTSPAAPAMDGFTAVALQSRLAGSTLNYRVNTADPTAGGVDTVTMVLEAPVLAWVALAFNNGDGAMPGSEAVIGLPDAGEVQKYNLNDRDQAAVVPMPESQQTLIDASITQTDTTTTLTFTKILVEPNEIPISIEADNTFLGAWGSSNTLGFHAQRDPFTVNLESGESASDGNGDKTKRMYMAHGFLAAFAWGALTPLAITSSMIRKCMPEGFWFQIHRFFNGFSVVLTIVAFALAVAAVGQSGGDNPGHFDKSIAGGHRLIGLIVFIVAILQATGGFLRPHLPPKEKDQESQQAPEKSAARKGWEFGHRFFGLCILGLTWFQVHLGIMQYHTLWGSQDEEPASLTAFWVIAVSIMGFGIIGWLATFNK